MTSTPMGCGMRADGDDGTMELRFMGKTVQGTVKSVTSASCTTWRCHMEAEPGERDHRCRAPLSLGRCPPSRPGPRVSLFRRMPGASFRAGKNPGGTDASGAAVTGGDHTPLRTRAATCSRKTGTAGAEPANCHHVLVALQRLSSRRQCF